VAGVRPRRVYGAGSDPLLQPFRMDRFDTGEPA